jgi:hypothetical protein
MSNCAKVVHIDEDVLSSIGGFILTLKLGLGLIHLKEQNCLQPETVVKLCFGKSSLSVLSGAINQEEDFMCIGSSDIELDD